MLRERPESHHDPAEALLAIAIDPPEYWSRMVIDPFLTLHVSGCSNFAIPREPSDALVDGVDDVLVTNLDNGSGRRAGPDLGEFDTAWFHETNLGTRNFRFRWGELG